MQSRIAVQCEENYAYQLGVKVGSISQSKYTSYDVGMSNCNMKWFLTHIHILITLASFLDCFISVGERLSGNGQRLSLTILKVSALIWPQEDIDYSRQLFCTVTLGQNLPRKTPSVEGKDTASWNFTVSA